MAVQPQTKRLLITLGLGWCSFACLGFGLRHGQQVPAITVIIDQSYCAPAQWQHSVVQPYSELYSKRWFDQRKIAQVVLVTDIDHTVLTQAPTPDELGQPFGQAPAVQTLAEIQAKWSEAVWLRCRQ